MNRMGLDLRFHPSGSGSTPSDESALDLERNYFNHQNLLSRSPSPRQAFASGGQLSESSAAYFSWPTSSRLNDAAEDRANYFGNLQKGVLPETLGRLPTGQQATTLLEVMTIRAFHSKILRCFSLGTAIGFRIRRGVLTDIPAILVFVARKVHKQWLSHIQCLPAALEGPGGVWCDVDVVEFSYFGAPAATPKEQLYTELVDGLRGSDPCIGSGSQVANQETYGTLGAIVKSRTGNRQVGFLTNRHVAVDLDYPNQKMFHPLPPSLGHGVYLGAVERATSFITDALWYGIFAGTNPETFVRADGAFIPFAEEFNMSNVSTSVKGIGEIGDVNIIDLQSSINSLIGRQVIKVGRSSGLTTGTIMAYALEYNDEKGICFFTDFLVVGENQQTFDLEGDSGSLILLTSQNGEKPRPVGIIWGGTANRGRLKLKVGQPPENWTSGVDLGRLLDLLELDLITTNEGLQAALHEQRNTSAAGIDSTVGESSSPERKQLKEKTEENFKPLGLNIQIPIEGQSHQDITPHFLHEEFHIKGGSEAAPNVEYQFIPSFAGRSPIRQNNKPKNAESKDLVALRNWGEEISVSLQLGEPEPKRSRTCPQTQQVLSHTILTPNHLIRALISQWCKSHGFQLPDSLQYSDEDGLTESDRDRFLSLLEKMSSTLSDQKEAARELRLLTKRTPSFRALFGESLDAIPQLLNPLSQNKSRSEVHPDLQEDLITTVLNLSIHDNNKKLVAETPIVIPLLLDALRSGTIQTRSNAAATLFTLSALDSNKTLIGKSGTLKPLIDLLEDGHPLAMKDVASAIFNLCILHENKLRAVRDGAVRVILEKLMNRMHVDELLAILAMLSTNQKAVEELGELGAVSCLLSIIRESSCARNKENCIAILHTICFNDRTMWREMREEENTYGTISEVAQNGTSRAKRKAGGILERLNRAVNLTHTA